jgi:aspartate beta-hydroxylase
MKDEKLEVKELELTEEEKLKLAEEEKLRLEEEEKLRLEEEKKKEEERLAKEKKEKEDKIQELIDSVDFEEEETHKRWDRETEAEVEYKVVLVHQFLHNLKFCDHIKYKEEIEDYEGKIIEVEKEKEVFWNKKLILKHLKENLDVDKAQSLVDQIASYKHNKKKGKLESKLRLLVKKL